MRSRPVLLALALAVAAIGGGACSQKAGYGSATRAVFEHACNPQSDSGERRDVCRCAYDELTQRYTYDEYKDIDRQVRDDPSALPDDVLRIVADCGSRSSASASS